MKPYLDLLRHVLQNGEHRKDRTGVGAISVFGTQTRYDLRWGFPLVTTKKVNFDSVVRELLWFLSGSTNVKDLHPCRIWDNWANTNERVGPVGDLGPIYGFQWRKWPNNGDAHHLEGTDQIAQVIRQIRETPDSRRIIVSAWNVSDLDRMAIPPCHTMFQFYVGQFEGKWKYLDLHLYMRSADLALGVPFNIASYALLLTMIAQETNLEPRYFVQTIGDAHIYRNHLPGIIEQLDRTPKLPPRVVIANKPFDEIRFEDITLHNYQHHPAIKFEIAV